MQFFVMICQPKRLGSASAVRMRWTDRAFISAALG
jgi:hypothetical protein